MYRIKYAGDSQNHIVPDGTVQQLASMSLGLNKILLCFESCKHPSTKLFLSFQDESKKNASGMKLKADKQEFTLLYFRARFAGT